MPYTHATVITSSVAPSHASNGTADGKRRLAAIVTAAQQTPRVSDWRSLAQVGGDCGHNAAYATFISGDKYLPGAVCLRRSLLAAGNRCPMDIVYDDRSPQLNLSAKAREILLEVYGAQHLFSLTQIMARHPSSLADMAYSAPRSRAARAQVGRQLFERGIEHMATHSKLWFWGHVARSRLVMLDADMVVLGPLDWMMTHALTDVEDVAAAGVLRGSRSFFNSGLLVLQPSVDHLRNLTQLAARAREGTVPPGPDNQIIGRAGEKLFGDQSLLNWYFRGRWKPLPAAMVRHVPAKVSVDPARILAMDPAVLHWVSEPKPWSRATLRKDGITHTLHPSTSQAQLWCKLCCKHLNDLLPRLGRAVALS